MKYTYKFLKKCTTLALITMMALLAFAIPAAPVYAEGTITNADTQETYATFAAAIASVDADGTLNLNISGDFTENIVIDKAVNVTITGEGMDSTTIEGQVIASGGATLTLESLFVSKPAPSADGTCAVSFSGAGTGGSIKNCKVEILDLYHGWGDPTLCAVEVKDEANLTEISGSKLTSNYYGLYVYENSGVDTITECDFYYEDPGIIDGLYGRFALWNNGTIGCISDSTLSSLWWSITNEGGKIDTIDNCILYVEYDHHSSEKSYALANIRDGSINTIKNCNFPESGILNSGILNIIGKPDESSIQTITNCTIDTFGAGITNYGLIDSISECDINAVGSDESISSLSIHYFTDNTYNEEKIVPSKINEIVNVNAVGDCNVLGGEVQKISGSTFHGGYAGISIGTNYELYHNLPGKVGTIENVICTSTSPYSNYNYMGGIALYGGAEIGTLRNASASAKNGNALMVGQGCTIDTVEGGSYIGWVRVYGDKSLIKTLRDVTVVGSLKVNADVYNASNGLGKIEKIIGGTYGSLEIECDDVEISGGPVVCLYDTDYHVDYNRAIENEGKSLVLEPDLEAESPLQGYGRYFSSALGGDGLIRNDDDNYRILPKFREGTPDEQTYHMSKRGELIPGIEEIFTTEIGGQYWEGVENAKFRYLTVDVEVKFLKNDSAATGITDTYADEWRPDLPAPECGYRNGIKIFDGWNTKADGSGTMYQVGDFIDIPDTKLSLYAQWADPEHTVSFDSDGGTKVDKQTVVHKAKASEPDDPTRENYKFVAWTLNGKYYNFDEPVTKDITLKAQWERNPTAPVTTMHTITYDLNGGTLYGETGIVEVQYDDGTTIQLPKPEKAGCTFDYWEGSRYEAGVGYTVKGDHRFTAHWVKSETKYIDEVEFVDEDEGCEDDEDSETDEAVPSRRIVNTSDDNMLGSWLIIFTLSILSVYILVKYRRRA